MVNLEQVKADIAARKAMPAWGPQTSIERIKTINATLPSFSLKTVEALVDMLEKTQRANAAQDDHINQQQNRIDQLENKNGELGRRLYQYSMEPGEAERRIAELESRIVKLPKLKMLEDYLAEVAIEERKQILAGVKLEFHRSLTAAGIKWEAGTFRENENSSTASFREISETSTKGGNQ
ncbi:MULTISPECIES: hypothetical protein [Klebsiella]|uniref:hypothetical protein n=1 Tax=Klebsiella TaxID=570 RepID=UPI0006689D09|nr:MULTISPECIES: hypothetical protein [Klebsiella]GJK94393.1 hypothetical protein TUM17568_55990 [Klebsiella oxytoca]MDH0814616.1 hypothetical protein [Klebsiella grimontii]MDH2044706.1 hypothetical protein [Klebsiella grimontii]MDK3048821.1 hypothetical protein [Klebsiella michiganensis]GJL00312.1 hypothetical protein TUM17569_57720 [Klebsiella oxytoca]